MCSTDLVGSGGGMESRDKVILVKKSAHEKGEGPGTLGGSRRGMETRREKDKSVGD